MRIALANIRFPGSPDESIALAIQSIDQASREGAAVICFPECYVPGYRARQKAVPPPDREFLERAWSAIARAAAAARVTVVLGTERFVDETLVATALVINQDGSTAGFQDKVQVDPSEEGTYAAGTGRQVFQAGALIFGVVICHEGWRYPETVRWAARRGAQLIFHPQFHEAEPGSYRPDPLCGPGEHVSRKGGTLPCRRKHVLFRNRQLRQHRFADDFGRCESRWHLAHVPTLRRGRLADRRYRPYPRHRPVGRTP